MGYTYQPPLETGDRIADARAMTDRYLLSAHASLEMARETMLDDPEFSDRCCAMGLAEATLAAAYFARSK